MTAEVPAPPEARVVLRRACYDCHSNETVWSWDSRVAPVSWLLASDVRKGRDALDFSTWDRHSTKEQVRKLKKSWDEAAEGEMPPWFYLPVHRDAVLAAEDKVVLREWALGTPQHSIPARSETGESLMKPKIEIPPSIQAEHEAIHSELVEATKAPGRTGAAARALAEVLHPHFVREEEIALPPLGLLALLAAGTTLSDAQEFEALAMTDSLRRELPKMIHEHEQIRAAVDGLRRAATEERALRYQQLADQLALHAQTEEQVLYPAAILIGDIIRARQPRK